MGAPGQHAQSTDIITHPVAANRVRNPWLERPRERPLDIIQAKERVSLADVVSETHVITRGQKTICPVPAHDDQDPSCHIYNDDHWHCFSCGESGDVIDWLEHVHGLSTPDAVAELRRRAGGGTVAPTPRCVSATPKPAKKPELRPIDGAVLEAHLERATKLAYGPQALAGRGFSVSDLRLLGIAADGDDAIIPITGPSGDVLALKRRYAKPRGKMRYVYDTPGHGAPAWCSLGFADCPEALVIEGELNGMACWLARPTLGVQGVAGTSGDIHAEALKGKIVYVYGDGDRVGLEARDRWAGDAVRAGAAKVYVLEPWEMDACDIAGQLGRAELAGRLS